MAAIWPKLIDGEWRFVKKKDNLIPTDRLIAIQSALKREYVPSKLSTVECAPKPLLCSKQKIAAVTGPVVTRQAVTRPAVTRPAVTGPAVTKPAVTRPPVTKPAVTKPANSGYKSNFLDELLASIQQCPVIQKRKVEHNQDQSQAKRHAGIQYVYPQQQKPGYTHQTVDCNRTSTSSGSAPSTAVPNERHSIWTRMNPEKDVQPGEHIHSHRRHADIKDSEKRHTERLKKIQNSFHFLDNLRSKAREVRKDLEMNHSIHVEHKRPGLTKEQRKEIETKVVQALTTFEGDLSGKYYALSSLTEAERK